MDDIAVPYRQFEQLLTGFVCYEGIDLGRFYKDGKVAHPGDPFGEVFAWLWDTRRDTAVSLFADLLAEARRNGPEGMEVTLDALISGLRFALHRTRISEANEYDEVERVLRTKVPGYFGGRTDI
ncbi:hypothetical protein OG453_33595 [Streptomyces sp. NBC_01381]|uniref:hypothetical protein n=1 Tax=Streptomyces sp. NBC_01381 TaxID=2903845 RepID=UPI00225944BF|nr:hypothetical protein [Streptomyces sp. NBC_01381]MCX4671567.1 hypothetical protein [Streptomyces sp. NBC_01381]